MLVVEGISLQRADGQAGRGRRQDGQGRWWLVALALGAVAAVVARQVATRGSHLGS